MAAGTGAGGGLAVWHGPIGPPGVAARRESATLGREGKRGRRRVLGFRQRPLHGRLRRLRVALQGWLGNRPPRTQRVYLVEIEERRFKRLVLPDSHAAQRVARQLGRFAGAGLCPSLVFERENELWVDFVEGELLSALEPLDDAVLGQIADFFAALYASDARRVPVEATPFVHALHTDLRFLHDVGVIGTDAHEALRRVAARETPKEVWVGTDCVDAILKNFVRTPDGRLVHIAVESLWEDQLLGSGVAKAAVRWLGPRRSRFLDLLEARDVPGFLAYFDFVELCFLGFWLKQSFLEGKRRFVDPGLFSHLLEGELG
jgi:hypothetical protein